MQKSTRSHHDYDLETGVALNFGSGPQDIALNDRDHDRDSTYSLTSDEASIHSHAHAHAHAHFQSLEHNHKPASNDPMVVPVSPATAAAQDWMRPPSNLLHSLSLAGGRGGPYETTSELVAVMPDADGRRRVVATPIPVLAAVGGRREGRERESFGSGSGGLSRMGSMSGNIYPGR